VSGRILENLSGQPIDEHGIVGATFGVATTDDDGSQIDADELLRRADHALLCGKRAGKGRVLHFDDCPPSCRKSSSRNPATAAEKNRGRGRDGRAMLRS